jgi:hypothetical protein
LTEGSGTQADRVSKGIIAATKRIVLIALSSSFAEVFSLRYIKRHSG